MMEAAWVADRTALQTLLREHPDWHLSELAEAVNRSLGWVKKWVKRFRAADPNDTTVVQSRSRARKRPPLRVAPVVVERILALRDDPPANLGRIPGPKAILYYLQRDEELLQQASPPRSTRTIWRILRQHQRITEPRRPSRRPVPRPAPLSSWQLDFKDVTTVAPQPDGKQQHVIEVLNTVDVGTSLLVSAQARADFTAETAFLAVASLLEEQGLPERVSLDRDPRWVGSQHHRDFPAPLVRFLICLGVQVTLCPPKRPDKNGFVERYHRTYDEECIQVYRPADLEQVQTVTERFRRHYNEERPHQGMSCGNRPPRVAFPELPKLPAVPETVDPDRWLKVVDGTGFVRRVGRDGLVRIDSQMYYVSTRVAGQVVSIRVDASAGEFVVSNQQQEVKRLAIRGVGGGLLPFKAYVERMQAEARSHVARRQHNQRQLRLPLEEKS
jgi:transposase InsO family protein